MLTPAPYEIITPEADLLLPRISHKIYDLPHLAISPEPGGVGPFRVAGRS